jgi:glycosyltransferase involved in cell wall biosynthesis
MADSLTVLDPEIIRQCNAIGHADILVGIPSFRNADTISHVARNAALGMVTYFPSLKPVLLNSDGGSKDQTPEVFLSTPVPDGVAKIATPYNGLPGKGSAFRAIFEIASRLKTRICIVVDSDLRSITPEWIRLLGEPVWKHSYGFVAPYYIRHKYDGTITNNLAYPLTRALYGNRIRQPIGGDFGMTGSLALLFSHMDVWKTDIAKFGIDIWMTTMAVTEGFRVCQSAMGLKIHNVKDPGSDLASMFMQVASTIFYMMGENEVKWMGVKSSTDTRVFGDMRYEEPSDIEINIENLIDHFTGDYGRYVKIWEQVLTPANMLEVAYARQSASSAAIIFLESLWAKIVYDFAIAYNFNCDIPCPEIVKAMVPLYCARTAAFALQTANMSNMEAEQLVQIQAEEFEWQKPYLVKRWLQARETATARPESDLAPRT